MAVILHDTFNRSNASVIGTADTGQTWSETGTRGISNNQAFANAGFGGCGVSLTLTANYVTRVTFTNINTSETPRNIFWRQDGTVFVGVEAVPAGYRIVGFNFDDGNIVHASSTVVPVNGDIITVTVDYTTKVADVYLNGTAVGNKILTWTLNSKYPMANLTGIGLGGSGTLSMFDEYYVANNVSDLPAIGGGTTHEASAAMTGVSTLTSSATLINPDITGSASLQGVGIVTATANVISPAMTGSASMTGVGTVSATASVIQAGSATLTGVSTLTAFAAGLAVPASASLVGVGYMTVTAIEGAPIVSTITLYAREETTINLSASEEYLVNLYALETNSVILGGGP